MSILDGFTHKTTDVSIILGAAHRHLLTFFVPVVYSLFIGPMAKVSLDSKKLRID